ncbi:hypothetical protein C1H46_008692 [Malus baccata]|uniref:Uncharacterized protein n=1 Tax=Malus baccata TaxID=106549 RepID=A0A540N551_MALBA|nr:hypothetical protein C1H46_008692 [Malus baccata]
MARRKSIIGCMAVKSLKNHRSIPLEFVASVLISRANKTLAHAASSSTYHGEEMPSNFIAIAVTNGPASSHNTTPTPRTSCCSSHAPSKLHFNHPFPGLFHVTTATTLLLHLVFLCHFCYS